MACLLLQNKTTAWRRCVLSDMQVMFDPSDLGVPIKRDTTVVLGIWHSYKMAGTKVHECFANLVFGPFYHALAPKEKFNPHLDSCRRSRHSSCTCSSGTRRYDCHSGVCFLGGRYRLGLLRWLRTSVLSSRTSCLRYLLHPYPPCAVRYLTMGNLIHPSANYSVVL